MDSVSRREHLPEVAWRHRAGVLAVLLLLAAPVLHAAGLGGYEVQSSLGGTLRLVVQVTARADETLDEGCFRIHPYTVNNDGLPQLTAGQLTLDRRGNEQRLIITSPRPILDPIVRVSIDVGCDTMLRRDLTLLLDPPPAIATQAETPASAAAASVAAAPAARPATPTTAEVAGSGTAAGGAGSGVPGNVTGAPAGIPRARGEANQAAARPARQESAATTGRDAAAPAAPAAPPRVIKARGPEAAAQRVPRPSKPAAQPPRDRLSISTSGPPLENYVGAPITPRLTLSTTLTDRSDRPPLPESVLSIIRQKQSRLRAAPTDEDIPSLEAELLVLQKRTAEMRSQLDAVMANMQSLLETTGAKGGGNPPAAQPAKVEPDAGATPVSSLPAEPPEITWSWRDPRLLLAGPLVLIIVLLFLGFGIWLRRERWHSRRAARWNRMPYVPATTPPPPPPPETSFGAGRNGDESAERQPAVPVELPPMRDSYAFSPFSTGHAARELGVSDLAQATEKASVFVTLGRPEQAIDVLRDHVDHESKPSPMAWLMLLDLYRQTSQRSEFAEIAQRFHLAFNAETPAWDQTSPLHDAGLAAFPHLLRKIRDDWPGAKALAYVDELLYDNRGGSRIGFSLPAFRDLLLLHSMIDDHLIALDAPARTDPSTGALMPPPPPPAPPQHLAKAWATATGRAPEYPAGLPLQLDASLLSESSERSTLEKDYPIIVEAIMKHWGQTGAADYLANLIRTTNDSRGPSLSNPAMAELILLHDVALELGDPQPDYSVG